MILAFNWTSGKESTNQMAVTFQLKRVSMSDPVFDTVTDRILESYKNACVLYIDEVYNFKLWEAFQSRKESMPGSIEMDLFHGTSSANIKNIMNYGFKKEYNKVSAYGLGTYFAKNASYSKDYTNVDHNQISYVFICTVLIGECEIARTNAVIKKDNSVDNMRSPTIYVTPYDDACIPKYVVAFHKDAK